MNLKKRGKEKLKESDLINDHLQGFGCKMNEVGIRKRRKEREEPFALL